MLCSSVRLLLISSGSDGGEVRESGEFLLDSGCRLGSSLGVQQGAESHERRAEIVSKYSVVLVYLAGNISDPAH